MIALVKQEIFKLSKKKSSYIMPIIIYAIMIILATLSNFFPELFSFKDLFEQGFSAFSWLIFLMIIQASTAITMEFHYGTIKNLLYKNESRINIITSKIIALLIYSLILFVLSIILSLILYLILFSDVDILEHSNNDLSLLNKMLLIALATYVGMWLIISLTLLISCIMKTPGVSIAVGLVFYFASSIVSGLLFSVINEWEWIKWNPLNMMNIVTQIIDNEAFSKFTKLELHELFIGNIIYTLIFLVLVVFIFQKKDV